MDILKGIWKCGVVRDSTLRRRDPPSLDQHDLAELLRTPAQKALELETIKKTAVSALEGMVGQKGVKRYKWEVGSIWLHNVGTMNPMVGQDLIAPDE